MRHSNRQATKKIVLVRDPDPGDVITSELLLDTDVDWVDQQVQTLTQRGWRVATKAEAKNFTEAVKELRHNQMLLDTPADIRARTMAARWGTMMRTLQFPWEL